MYDDIGLLGSKIGTCSCGSDVLGLTSGQRVEAKHPRGTGESDLRRCRLPEYPSSNGNMTLFVFYSRLDIYGHHETNEDRITCKSWCAAIVTAFPFQEVCVTGDLAPFDEVSVAFRGPMNLHNIAWYEGTAEGILEQTSSWTPG